MKVSYNIELIPSKKNIMYIYTDDNEIREYNFDRVKKYNPWNVIIAVDESGSMLDSVIHSAIMAGIFSKLPMLPAS